MSVSKPDTAAHYIGSQTLGTNIQNAGVAGKLITVRMGEVTFQNELINSSAINAGPYDAVNTPVNVDVLHRGGTMNDYGLFYGQSISKDIAFGGMLGSVSFIGGSYPNVTTAVYVPAAGDSSAATMNTPWKGELAILAVKLDEINSVVTRAPFGKFQKIIKGQYAGAFTWAMISDPIADSIYGTVADLKNSDLVILPQPIKRAEVVYLKFNNNRIEMNVTWNTNNANGNVYDGNLQTLILRSSELLENHEAGTPYPRVIKAGRADVVNGQSTIAIPASSTINLTESRYVVQHAVEMTSAAGAGAFSSVKVNKTAKQIVMIQPNNVSSGTFIHHYAIWDLGPGTIQFTQK